MDVPMIYLESGCVGLTCGNNEDDPVWLEPGWYEVAKEGYMPYRDVDMLTFKDDTEPEYAQPSAHNPVFNSFREMSRYLQGYDPDTALASSQSEGLAASYLDTETKWSLQPPQDSQTPDQHLSHPGPLPDWLAWWCDESAGRRMGTSGDSSSET